MHHEIGVIDGDRVVWRERFAQVDDAEGSGDGDVVGGGAEEGDFDVEGGFWGWGIEGGRLGEGGGGFGGGGFGGGGGVGLVVATEETCEGGGFTGVG